MLQIPQSQFDELARQAHEVVVARIRATLQTEFPDEWRSCGTATAPGTPAAEEALRQVLNRGWALGMEQPRHEAAFAALFFINLRFGRAGKEPFLGWTKTLLERKDVDADERLALVSQGLAWRGQRNQDAAAAHERLQRVMEAFP